MDFSALYANGLNALIETQAKKSRASDTLKDLEAYADLMENMSEI